MRNFLTAVAALAATALVGAGPANAQARNAQATVQAAATAMGGVDKLRSIRNITLSGYGQYAYMFGAGRITGEANAPEKYIAANELTRVYDIENSRFQLKERRSMLFPFLAPFGHSWAVNNQILDGDVAYDLRGENAVRVSNMSDGALYLDGVHVRRMWMMTNPAVALRAMLESSTRLSTPRMLNGETVIDVTLAQGDKFSVGFRSDSLPSWMRWNTKHTNFGQIGLTTYYTGWADATGNSGILLPLGYDTRIDYRNVDYFKMYVDGYVINTDVSALAAPAPVRSAAVPPSYAVPTITSKVIGKGIWRVDQGGTVVIEFKDHLVIYELGQDVATAKAVLAHARTLAPNKPITQYIASHNHLDHVQGIRQAVAEGATVIQRKGSETSFRDMVSHPASDYPDDLARAPKPFKFTAVDQHLRLTDGTQTVDIYAVPNNGHMADAIIAYVPSEKLMIEGDLVTAAFDWQHWPDGFRDVIARFNLDVARIAGVHGTPAGQATGTFSKEHAEELLSGGTKRAREHCAALAASVHPGCPIQSKYY